MSATLDVSCPNCSKALKVPAEHVGKRVKCKGCAEIFTITAPAKAAKAPAKAPAGKAAPPPPPPEEKPKSPFLDEDEDEVPGQAPKPMGVVHEEDVARCPHCAAELDPPTAVVAAVPEGIARAGQGDRTMPRQAARSPVRHHRRGEARAAANRSRRWLRNRRGR